MTLLDDVPIVEQQLSKHAGSLGVDRVPYRNHVYRVLNFGVALSAPDAVAIDKLAIAAVFHDLGIWTAKTFDYLAPSMALADRYLEESGRSAWRAEVLGMIGEHHKLTPFSARPDWLVEPFRRADLTDVTRGWLPGGVDAATRARVFARWPAERFRWRLVQLTFARAVRHPLDPLPMVHL